MKTRRKWPVRLGIALAAAFLMSPLGAFAATGGSDPNGNVQTNDEPMTPLVSEVTATTDDAATTTTSTSGNTESAHLPRASVTSVPTVAFGFNRLDASATSASATTQGTAGAPSSGCGLWVWQDSGANDHGGLFMSVPTAPDVPGLLLTFSSVPTAPIANSGGANDHGAADQFSSARTTAPNSGAYNSGGMNAIPDGNSADNPTAYAVPDPNGPGYTAWTSTAGLDNSAANNFTPTAYDDNGHHLNYDGATHGAANHFGTMPSHNEEGGPIACRNYTASNGM